MIGNLCLRPEGDWDWGLFHALHEWMPWEYAMDGEEIVLVGRTWRDAAQANAAYWNKMKQG